MEKQKTQRKKFDLKKEFNNFRISLKEPEYKLIFTLDLCRALKMSFGFLGYMMWLYLARIGWSNLYSIFRIFVDDDNVKSGINTFGSLMFNLLLVALIVLQGIKIPLTTKLTGYLSVLKPFQEGIKIICKQGSLVFLIGVYVEEINFLDYRSVTVKLGSFVLLYLVATVFEKGTFKKIETLVQSEICKEEFCLETPYGKIQNVPLTTFCLNNKWEKHLYRSEKKVSWGSYSPVLHECLRDTGAISDGEIMIIKDVFGDYEIAFLEQQEKETVRGDSTVD